jgi:hypothetical protein
MFIAGIIIVSLVSRVTRTTELRADRIEFDPIARRLITDAVTNDNALNIIANKRQAGDVAEYAEKEAAQRSLNPIPGHVDLLFLEVEVTDPSNFSDILKVRGVKINGYKVLRVDSPAVPNAIAAVLLTLRNVTGIRPHCFFEWSEGSPLVHLVRYLILGEGDTAPVVHEILRKRDEDPARRPAIHVGG